MLFCLAPAFSLASALLQQTAPRAGVPPVRTFAPHAVLETLPYTFTPYMSSEGPGSTLFLLPSEFESHVDLNLDGDQADKVVLSYDMATGASRLLDLWGSAFQTNRAPTDLPRLAESPWTLFLISESEQAGDENGDGDTADRILYAVRDSTVVSSGLSATGIALGEKVILAMLEWANGNIDQNGDGAIDLVLYAWEPGSGAAPVSLGQSLYDLDGVGGDVVLFTVFEAITSSDENGDGDVNDQVLFGLRLSTGAIFSTGLAGGGAQYNEGAFAFGVSEMQQQEDLNGDGDLQDGTIHVMDEATGVVTNLGLATSNLVPLGGQRTPTTFEHGRLVFHVSELDQGDTNGDGDTGDFVLHVYFPATGELRNLGVAAWDFAFDRERLVFQAGEVEQGVDFDGSGDLGGFVYLVYGFEDASTWNTRLLLRNPWFGTGLSKWHTLHARYARVFTGSNTAQELVLLDLRSRRVQRTGLLGEGDVSRFLDSGLLAVRASERAMNQDHNGDGDKLDDVLHYAWPGLGRTLNTGVPVDTFAGSSGDVLAFFSNEDRAGVDLNGDGTIGDWAFQRVRLVP